LIPSLLHDPRSRPAWLVVLVLLLAIISGLAFGPASHTPNLPGWDKVNHLLAFLVLGTVASFAHAPGWRRTMLTASGLLLYGAFIEIVQAQLPNRHGDWDDLVADVVGLLCGLLLAAALRRATAAAHASTGAKAIPD
jgi:VanZ family protein